MLKELNLGEKLDASEWDAISGELKEKLGELQQRIRTLKIPVVILFEGWGASGKGSMISRVISSLDPRGFSVYSIGAPTADEQRYPWMQRFWRKLPAYGDIAIFDRSWYRGISLPERGLSKKEIGHRLDEIADFEQQITDDGYILLKFFLQISQKEQKRRFKSLEDSKATRWRVTDADWRQNDHYEEALENFDDILCSTDFAGHRWTVVDASDKRFATKAVFEAVITAMEEKIAEKESGFVPEFAGIRVSEDIQPLAIPSISELELDQEISEEAYRRELKDCQKRLFELHNRIYQKKIPVILAYEGSDAAGKGGNIKRITQALDPRGFEVVPVCAPTPPEKNHQHLWRFWNTLPRDGHIAIFDRTWYGRVLVEHIEGFCTDEQWGRAYDEINRFERNLADWGAVVMKFWLQIDADEQLQRFTARQNTPSKQYKITDEDWRNREKWTDYEKAVDEMLLRTNTAYAPWVVVESNNKHFARIKTMHAIIDSIEKRL